MTMQKARPMPADTGEDNRMSVSGRRLCTLGGTKWGGGEDDVVVAVQEEADDAEGQADTCGYG